MVTNEITYAKYCDYYKCSVYGTTRVERRRKLTHVGAARVLRKLGIKFDAIIMIIASTDSR